MGKSPQVMGMNEQKVLQIFIFIYCTQIGLFQVQSSGEPWAFLVLVLLGRFG